MGILDRIERFRAVEAYRKATPEERRTIGGAPWAPWESYTFGYRDSFSVGGPAHPSAAYYDEHGALSLAAVFASVKVICDSISQLPIRAYRLNDDGSSTRLKSTMLLGSPVAGGGPAVSGTLNAWLHQGTAAALLHGSAFGLITGRSNMATADHPDGLPTSVAWLPGDRVSVQNDAMQPEDTRKARVYYQGHEIPQTDLVHLPAFSVPGRLEGISPLRSFCGLFQQGQYALEFSRSFFQNGGHPPGILTNQSEEVDAQQAKEIRRLLTDTIKERQALILGRDWSFDALQVPQDEATMIKTMQLNAQQIAAVYQVPPWRVGGTRGDSMTYASLLDDQSDFVINGLGPWLSRWEALITSLLPSSQYAKFDTDALLKLDPEKRVTVAVAQRNAGLRSQNEVRSDDDLAPVEGGDDPIPLSVLEKMATTTKALPTSMVGLVEFEADRIARTVEDMTAAGVSTGPGEPVLKMTGQQYLASKVTARNEEMLTELRGELLALRALRSELLSDMAGLRRMRDGTDA